MNGKEEERLRSVTAGLIEGINKAVCRDAVVAGYGGTGSKRLRLGEN